LHAVPLDPYAEVGEAKGLAKMKVMMKMMTGMLRGRPARLRVERVPDAVTGPVMTAFTPVAALVAGTNAGATLMAAVHDAFASPVLPGRTKALVFAVVARALGSRVCIAVTDALLEREGLAADVRERVLGTLGGPELDANEAALLPWARETSFYRTEVIQRRTQELRDRIGVEAVTEAIGLAALANAVARIGMLGQ
jgi:hypothetical protein